MAKGDYKSEEIFTTLTGAGNASPYDIWSDNTTMWVVDESDSHLYAYNMSTKVHDSTKSFDAPDVDSSTFWGLYGVCGYEDTMWLLVSHYVSPAFEITLAAYDVATLTAVSTKDIALGSTTAIMLGVWTDGTTFYTLEKVSFVGNDYNINAYDSSGTYDSTKSWSMTSAQNLHGIWSDGTTLWVGEESETTGNLRAYTLSSGSSDSTKDFAVSQNYSLGGIWSDLVNIWVSAESEGVIQAYDFADSLYGTLNDSVNIEGTIIPPENVIGTVSNSVALSATLRVVQPVNLTVDVSSNTSLEATLSVQIPIAIDGEVADSTAISGTLTVIPAVNLVGTVSVGATDLDIAGQHSYLIPQGLDPLYRLADFSQGSVAPVPAAHLGERESDDTRVTETAAGNKSSSIGTLSVGDTLRMYSLPFTDYPISTDKLFGITDYLNVYRTGESVLTVELEENGTVVATKSLLVSSELRSEGIVFVVQKTSGNQCHTMVYSATTGTSIGDVGCNVAFLNTSQDIEIYNYEVLDSDGNTSSQIFRVEVQKEAGGGFSWYSTNAPYVYNSLGSTVLKASIFRGRDSQRQSTPPRVPSMQCEIWDPNGQVYWNRPYETGTPITMAAHMPDGSNQIVFTGFIDSITYKFEENMYKYSVTALGTTSKLVNEKVYGPCESDLTVEEAIGKTLSAANWDFGYDVADGIFPALLSHWWLDGSSAWNVIQKLVNTQGPPATFYENHLGELIFLGVGQVGVTSTEPISVSSSGTSNNVLSAIGKVEEKTVTEYVVNHAELNVIDYEEKDEFDDVWTRSTEFRILPNATYELTATFSPPVCTFANTDLPDFIATSPDLNVSFKQEGDIKYLNATRAIMVFNNPTSTPVRVRNVELQGKVLEEVGQSLFSSDSLDDLESVAASQEEHGVVEWDANVYNSITPEHGQQLALNIVTNYHEGVETFKLRLYHNNIPALLETMLRFNEGTTLRNASSADTSFGTSSLDGQRAYVRVFKHVWDGDIYYLDVEVEARSGAFFGVSPFIIGTSRLNELRGYSA